MAKSKFSENLIKLRCVGCKRFNYYTRKKKSLEKNWNSKSIVSGAASTRRIRKLKDKFDGGISSMANCGSPKPDF